jgi:hypothetical protein
MVYPTKNATLAAKPTLRGLKAFDGIGSSFTLMASLI